MKDQEYLGVIAAGSDRNQIPEDAGGTASLNSRRTSVGGQPPGGQSDHASPPNAQIHNDDENWWPLPMD